MLVVDGSETINAADEPGQDPSSFSILQNALGILTNQFVISPDGVLMGLLQYSNRTEIEVQLGTITNGDDMRNAIDNMEYQNGRNTLTTQALSESASQLEMFGREGVSGQIILLTDGLPNNIETSIAEAQRIRNDDEIDITVIGINLNINLARTTLMQISSTGEVIEANNVDEVAGLVSTILEETCPGMTITEIAIKYIMYLLIF